jgi:hypothetical protein
LLHETAQISVLCGPDLRIQHEDLSAFQLLQWIEYRPTPMTKAAIDQYQRLNDWQSAHCCPSFSEDPTLGFGRKAATRNKNYDLQRRGSFANIVGESSKCSA